jgi:hypothetical protein
MGAAERSPPFVSGTGRVGAASQARNNERAGLSGETEPGTEQQSTRGGIRTSTSPYTRADSDESPGTKSGMPRRTRV